MWVPPCLSPTACKTAIFLCVRDNGPFPTGRGGPFLCHLWWLRLWLILQPRDPGFFSSARKCHSGRLGPFVGTIVFLFPRRSARNPIFIWGPGDQADPTRRREGGAGGRGKKKGQACSVAFRTADHFSWGPSPLISDPGCHTLSPLMYQPPAPMSPPEGILCKRETTVFYCHIPFPQEEVQNNH